MDDPGPICQADRQRLEEGQIRMPPEPLLLDMAELFKVLGDGTRVRILWALFDGACCAGTIARLLGMSPSAISHQLRILKQARLVRYHREGRTVRYALADDHIRTIFDQGLEHVQE